MHLSSLYFGVAVIAIACGLESHRRWHEAGQVSASQLDLDYARSKRKNRLWTNCLMGMVGVLAATAGLVGSGPVWIVLWAMVPVVVLAIVLLAFADAVRTNTYLHRKIPELRAEVLGGTGGRIGDAPALASKKPMNSHLPGSTESRDS